MAATLFYLGAPWKLQPYFYFGDRYIILPVLLRATTTFCFKKSHSLRILPIEVPLAANLPKHW
jgi:hypothetical protein